MTSLPNDRQRTFCMVRRRIIWEEWYLFVQNRPNHIFCLRTPAKKSYTAYELDENDKVIRVTHVRKSVPDCTYHLFEIDGITYGQPFFPDQNKPYPQAIMAIQYANGHPAYHAMTKGDHYLYAEFYDYPDPNTVHADLYLFIPEGTVAPGVPKNFEAPFGAWDSPVTLDFYEQPYQPFAVKSL